MNRFFTLLFAAVCATAVGQLPDYVPTDGLVAWIPLDDANTFYDEQGGLDIQETYEAVPAPDRFGVPNGAHSFDGDDDFIALDSETQAFDFSGQQAISISVWVKPNSSGPQFGLLGYSPFSGVYPQYALKISGDSDAITSGYMYFISGVSLFESNGFNLGPTPLSLGEWSHLVMTYDGAELKFFLNGQLEFQNVISAMFPDELEGSRLFLGKAWGAANTSLDGSLDDAGLWSRALHLEEIQQLFLAPSPIDGCTDSAACNYNSDAEIDDGSCFEAPFIAAASTDEDSVSTCIGESISLTADGTTSAVDSTLLDAFTMTFNSSYSHVTPTFEMGKTYRIISNGRFGYADGWAHLDAAYNYAWDVETQTKVNCNGTQDAQEQVGWLFDNESDFQRPDNNYHNNDNQAFCDGSDKIYFWTLTGDGVSHEFSWQDCCYGDNSGSLDFWLYELTGVPGGPETTWSTGDQGATTELTPSESQWVTLTTMLDGVSLCQDSIWIEVVTSGCNDQNACNYSMLDVCSVDCIFPLVGEDCEAGAVACAAGTVWDAVSQTCVVATPAYLNEPGETAILNPCYFDSNGNGLVEVTDLMNVLSVYGLACGEITEAAFSCGGPLEYQGYDYETVQIGEQCWFAENLRAENYRNGDAIPADLDDSEWASTSDGAVTVYGEGSSECDNVSPDINACEPSHALEEYGRLYNWYAVDDARSLCPSGWGVPTDGEWMILEMALGMSESEANDNYYRGEGVGGLMKATFGWTNGRNGTNMSGFSGIPGGYRVPSGDFSYAGYDFGIWSSTPNGDDAMYRNLSAFPDYTNMVSRSEMEHRHGLSVRCIKDTE